MCLPIGLPATPCDQLAPDGGRTEVFVGAEDGNVYNGTVYTGSADDNVYAFDLSAGQAAPARPRPGALHPSDRLRPQR